MPSRRPAVTEDKERTRARILAAAIDVFAEHGYEGASTREICGRAGVNGAALNYHFRSKELMWLAVCDEVSARMQRIAFASVSLELTPRDALRRFLGSLFDGLAADPKPAQILVWAAMQSRRMDIERTLEAFRPFVDIAHGYFTSAQRAGLLPREVDVQLVLPILFAQFVYPFVAQEGQRWMFGGDLSQPKFAARLRALLLRSADLLLGLQPADEPQAGKRRRNRKATGRSRDQGDR
jgi:AcrR family transcriptional regulator